MRQLLFLAALWLPTLAAGQPTIPSPSNPEFMIVGQGGTSCGSYVLAFRAHGPRALLKYRGQEYATPTNSKIEWIAGFLAGVFMTTNYRGAIDMDAIGVWVNRYCEQRPTKPLIAAAMDMADELGACDPASRPKCRRAER